MCIICYYNIITYKSYVNTDEPWINSLQLVKVLVYV